MTTIARLFYMLIMADNHIDEKELEIGKKMAQNEGFDQNGFDNEVIEAAKMDSPDLFKTCVNGLQDMSVSEQTKYLAWMCLIANADGFMDRAEWSLIYRIYHHELNLDRQAILDCQVILSESLRARVLA